MFQIRLMIGLLVTVVFLSRTGAAQSYPIDSGQYTILNAQYGRARRHLDVTNRLKELARQDRAFRMGNSTFGIDPDPGQEKTLRIYARGLNGQERMFEYREGSTVDGTQFRSWDRGEWGNGPWNGGWEGSGYGLSNEGDSGQYVILKRSIRHRSPTCGRHQPFEGAGASGPRFPYGQQHVWHRS